jgi:cell division septation protein DedD
LQDQLKERLTGAAILVVIVVFAVPEMFHGRQPARPGDPAPGASAIPLRSYTIDLRATPAAQPAPGAPQREVDAPAPGDDAPIVPEPALAGPLPAPEAAPVAGPGSPAPGPRGAVQAVQAGEPAPQQAPPAARQSPTAGPAHHSEPDAAPAGRWAVQLGSFSRRELAERMTRQVRAKGFAVQLVGPDDRGLYRVRSALLADRAAASSLREKMIQKGFKPIINSSP